MEHYYEQREKDRIDSIKAYKKPRKQKLFTEDQERQILSYHNKGVTCEQLAEIMGFKGDKGIVRLQNKATAMGVRLSKEPKL